MGYADREVDCRIGVGNSHHGDLQVDSSSEWSSRDIPRDAGAVVRPDRDGHTSDRRHVARAFSLVGALSIVRFRTVVRDTKDTAFVIFAVAVGMAVGAGQPIVAVGGIAVVGLAATLFRDSSDFMMPFNREIQLTVRLGWSQAVETLIVEAVSKHASEIEPLSVNTVRHGAAMELSFRVRLLPTARPTELVAELNRIEGVQTVELNTQRPET